LYLALSGNTCKTTTNTTTSTYHMNLLYFLSDSLIITHWSISYISWSQGTHHICSVQRFKNKACESWAPPICL
jgi:hypothetical protein